MAKRILDASGLPFVSVIVINHNGSNYLPNLLNSLLRTEYPAFELVFVDNGSKDESVSMIQSIACQMEKVKLVMLPMNYGLSVARNVGAKASHGSILAFLDVDMEVTSGWLTPLVEFLAETESKDIVAVQGLIMDYVTRTNIQGAGELLVYFLAAPVIVGNGETDLGQFQSPFYALPAGGFTVVRRDIFEMLNGYDSGYFFMMEDLDLAVRIWMAGFRTAVVPTSKVYHVGGSRVRDASRKWFLAFNASRSTLRFVLKNYPYGQIARYAPFLVASHLLHIILLLSRHDSYTALGNLKGHLKGFLSLRGIIVSRVNSRPDEEYFKVGRNIIGLSVTPWQVWRLMLTGKAWSPTFRASLHQTST